MHFISSLSSGTKIMHTRSDVKTVELQVYRTKEEAAEEEALIGMLPCSDVGRPLIA